jgi:transcriptional regulator with XRE-family HTH domain
MRAMTSGERAGVGLFSLAAGRVLRETRLRLVMTLHDVSKVSSGRFKPSALGAYERGDRTISVQRFCELARIYGVSPVDLLSRVMDKVDPAAGQEVVLDLARMELVHPWIRRRLAEFIERVKDLRRDDATDVITLRAGDVAAIAAASGRRAEEVAAGIEPMLRPPGRPRGEG